MGNLTSQLPTMFWILKSMNLALNPSFWMIRAYLREASLESSSDFAPVTTILPDAKINAVVFGSRIRMITAAKRYTSQYYPHHDKVREERTLGLYSAFRACKAMVFRSRRQSRLTVATMFLEPSLAHVHRQRPQKGGNLLQDGHNARHTSSSNRLLLNGSICRSSSSVIHSRAILSL